MNFELINLFNNIDLTTKPFNGIYVLRWYHLQQIYTHHFKDPYHFAHCKSIKPETPLMFEDVSHT